MKFVAVVLLITVLSYVTGQDTECERRWSGSYCTSMLTGRCVSGWLSNHNSCGLLQICCIPPSATQATTQRVTYYTGYTTTAPPVRDTECERRWSGSYCTSMLTGRCMSGWQYNYNSCGFLQICCIPPSATQATTERVTYYSGYTTNAPPVSVTTLPSPDRPTSSCGRRLVSPPPGYSSSSRIVGGTESYNGEWPWQPIYRFAFTLREDNSGLDGGATWWRARYNAGRIATCRTVRDKADVNATWKILTEWATFTWGSNGDISEDKPPILCAARPTLSRWTAVTGEFDRTRREGTERVYHTSAMYTHASYSDTTNVNDIGMMKLTSDIVYNDYTQPACLPYAGESFDNMMCTATGWGSHYAHGPSVSRLEKVDMPVIRHTQCVYKFGSSRIGDGQMCAGFSNGGADTCQGDSGGPLSCQKGGVWKITGITSWGAGCGDPSSPGVYTRVSEMLDWINLVMRRFS